MNLSKLLHNQREALRMTAQFIKNVIIKKDFSVVSDIEP